MVLADLGRKITNALRSLNNSTIINEEVGIESNGVKNYYGLPSVKPFSFAYVLSIFHLYQNPPGEPIQFIP